jgi:hypothetical protein
MNRDGAPTPAAITMATTELLVAARRTWHRLSANYGRAVEHHPKLRQRCPAPDRASPH